jgi:hypothetical protein
LAAAHGNRPRSAAALATIAVATKMTLSLPFLGLLALQRRFVACVVAGGTWVLLNVLGFWRMGPASLHDYRASVGTLEAFGDINSPDPWNVLSSPRLDWTSLFYGLSGNIAASRLATLAATGLVVLWLLREGWRERAPRSLPATTLFLTPLVLLGSLCVYHHHYDSCLFFAPVLALYFVFRRRRLHRVGVLLLCPLLLMMLFLPIGLAQNAALALAGTRGVGLLKLAFPSAVPIALIGSLLLLRSADAHDERAG